MSDRELVEVSEPLGPGLDVEPGDGGVPVVVRARAAGPYLGLDRGFVVDSDDGTGRAVRALVALPSSSWRGCRVRVRWDGVVHDARGVILIGGIEGGARARADAVRAVAGLPDVELGSSREAVRLALEARRRFRERRAARRVVGGRAWELPTALLEAARFTTAHARPSYALSRLPPRYVLALERLLDPDERVLYAVERPFDSASSGWRRRAGGDRRAAILVLTDRQVLWVVDHADPDRFLSDWGVDTVCIPVERLRHVSASLSDARAVVRLETDAEVSECRLAREMAEEARLFSELAARFTPAAGNALPRRVYADLGEEIAWNRMDAFGEAQSVRELAQSVSAAPIAVLPSPARPGHRHTREWVLDARGVTVAGGTPARLVPFGAVHAVGLVLSPLEGRVELIGRQSLRLDVPAPYTDVAAAFARALRRRLASTPGEAPGDSS